MPAGLAPGDRIEVVAHARTQVAGPAPSS